MAKTPLVALLLALAGCAGPRPALAPWPPAPAGDPLVRWSRVDALSRGALVVVEGVGVDTARLRAWAVRVDPKNPAVRVRVAVSDDPADVRETTSSFARRAGACVAVNGGYFRLGAFPASAVGLIVQGGRMTDPPTASFRQDDRRVVTARAAVGFGPGGRVETGWATLRDGRLWRLDAPFVRAPGADTTLPRTARPWAPTEALGAGPLLVRSGRVRVSGAEEGFGDGHVRTNHPRTAVGRTADGALVLLVVDGRQPLSRGASLDETARLMRALGATDAVNLDGGGSSAVVVRGVRLNRPVGGTTEREVHNALVVTCGEGGR